MPKKEVLTTQTPTPEQKFFHKFKDATAITTNAWNWQKVLKKGVEDIVREKGEFTVDGVKYSLVKEKIFDVAQFKKAHPEVYSKYSGEYLKEKEILKK